ncbi:dolichyl-diphosphooligosaccharide--protein glycosyltransferase 48 kda subunit [Anaeramoeba flamelloides]|uniref:Dolichyl-diphosphooligosaccharide--protein glycosyltransferase 48 kDa subunit n=1 Tax=Anaeramoeba flamelloides TaxID=1746091 RepID=A0AAV7Z4N8_9EUKA|nr:dolichyl-diphosphooligosaccharide--protein glycosyltransferase 48 kda subunit [Anaeramoeba flamelloides]
MKLALFCICAFTLLTVLAAKPLLGPKTAVLLGNIDERHKYSQFFDSFTKKGYDLHFLRADDQDITLKKFGEYLYDQAILFVGKSEEINVVDVLDFIDSGRSVIVATSPDLSDSVRELAIGCGIEFDEQGTSVIDHFNFKNGDKEHTSIIANDFCDIPTVLGDFEQDKKDILFKGIGMEVKKNSPLNYRLLVAPPTSYSYFVDEKITEKPFVIGEGITLVSALQTRGDARVLFSGSIDMFSNDFFNTEHGNTLFCKEIASWAFNEKGFLRFRDFTHHTVNSQVKQDSYRIKDDIEFSVIIEEYDLEKGWKPYVANDVQIEYVMLSPYVRQNLVNNPETGKFSTKLSLPDKHGTFKFRLQYHKRGYRFLEKVEEIPLKPFWHNQYERFIPVAYPYYLSAILMLVGFFIFSIIFLYHKDDNVEKKNKKAPQKNNKKNN